MIDDVCQGVTTTGNESGILRFPRVVLQWPNPTNQPGGPGSEGEGAGGGGGSGGGGSSGGNRNNATCSVGVKSAPSGPVHRGFINDNDSDGSRNNSNTDSNTNSSGSGAGSILTVSLLPCPRGWSRTEGGQSCARCQDGTYSVVENAAICSVCPRLTQPTAMSGDGFHRTGFYPRCPTTKAKHCWPLLGRALIKTRLFRGHVLTCNPTKPKKSTLDNVLTQGYNTEKWF